MFEFLGKVVDETGKKGYFKCSSAKIENEDVTFTSNFLIENVGAIGSWRIDFGNVHSRDGSSLLRGLPFQSRRNKPGQ